MGYLVAYDYEMLKLSLPTVYNAADKIVLAIDKNRLTFAGQPFSIDPSFFDWLDGFDTKKKIAVYEDVFYQRGLTGSQIETRIRNLLAQKMGEGGWHVQVDVDEYFVNMNELVAQLRALEKTTGNNKITVMAYLSSIFKIADGGYYMIGNPEKFALATNHPVYESHRYNDAENERVTVNHLLAHQSWGRTEAELKTKLVNWAHRDDFDTEAYFRFWKSLNRDNYSYVKNFHPMKPSMWENLLFIEAGSIAELLAKMKSRTDDKAPQEKFQKMRKWLPPVLYNRLQKMA